MEFFTGESLHRPLSRPDPSEIRLVKLYPGDFDDAVRCELEYVSLAQDNPVYTAVSYTWGDPHVTDSILLDGEQYPVTINLQSFLRHMQAILLAITKFLPGTLQVPSPHSRLMRYFVVQSILEDSDFPQDFPSTTDSVMHRLVERHVRKVLAKGLEQCDSIDDALDKLHNNVYPCEPTECSMYFWIDALCINQRDVHEKSQQVGRMKDIYSNAPSLLIWLGDVSESTAKGAMGLIHDIQAVAWPYLEGNAEDMEQFSSEDFVQPRLDATQKFMQLLTQEWFFRMWIIQEVATATGSTVALVRFQPVQWGFLTHVVFACCSQMLSSDGLQSLLVMAGSHDKILKTLLELTRCYQGWTQETRTEPDGRLDEDVAQRLKKLLRCSKGLFKATDPRDLLYALLGLLGTGSIPQELSPNYAIPFKEVFHQYAVYIIKHTKSLGFLPCYKRQLEGVPSWVPDWRYCRQDRSDFDWINSGLSYAEVSEDGTRLEIDGISLGQVVTVVYPVSIAANIENQSLFGRDTADGADDGDVAVVARGILAVFRGMQKLKRACLESLWAVSPNVSRSTFQNQWENFWPGFTDQSFQTQVEMLEGRRELELREVVEGAPGVYFVRLGEEIRSLSQNGIAILDGAELISSIRQDEPVQEGDTVCVLKGMNGPCILRREGLYYRFIGDCDMTSLAPSILEGEFCGLRQTERFVLV
ncbi:heterokaryon incompatibility protein-domain-containing protein [Ilyonectria sp. MPI-CAGE-AT-0026]|nr:heterokaryon incompatibility protein-domain-containing protein [Ilyonectria sp. MPI-CAGE-AT-0026]